MYWEQINLRAEIEKRKDAIIKDLQQLVAIKSDTFTPGVQNALDHVLAKGQEAGYQTKFIDGGNQGISGHLHYGNHDQFIGIIGHLDTVPAVATEWKHHPLSGYVSDDGFIWGRGVEDDKGPMVACFHALNILKELNVPLRKGVRLIYGTQEEGNHWSDISYYLKQEKHPFFSFTPDGSFPLIYAQKGLTWLKITGQIDNQEQFAIKGGTVPNTVAEQCQVWLGKRSSHFSGTALHSMWVYQGSDSAIDKALTYLNKQVDNDFIKTLTTNFAFDPTLSKTGIGYQNEWESPLSCNLGMIDINQQGQVEVIFDIRWPQKTTDAALQKQFQRVFQNIPGLEVQIYSSDQATFTNPQDPKVQILERAYREVTNDYESKLITTGGSSYASLMPNCVGYGMAFKDDPETVHQVNERLKITSLLKAVEIYCKAIYQLTK